MHLIIIRGNSGSGKSTIAKRIQQYLGEGVMVIGQDEVRRQMLNVRDRPGNLAINLIEEIINYGINHCDYVILEGILNKYKYGRCLIDFLKSLTSMCMYIILICHFKKQSVDIILKNRQTLMKQQCLSGLSRKIR